MPVEILKIFKFKINIITSRKVSMRNSLILMFGKLRSGNGASHSLKLTTLIKNHVTKTHLKVNYLTAIAPNTPNSIMVA